MKTIGMTAATTLLLTGCSRSPSIEILGAFFPDWMFCIVGAMVLVGLLRSAARSLASGPQLEGPILFLAYPAVVTLFSLLGWVAFFQN